MSNWSGWLRRVQHVEGSKKRKKQKQDTFCYGRAERKKERNKKAIRPMRAKERKWLKQSQDKWLVFNVT